MDAGSHRGDDQTEQEPTKRAYSYLRFSTLEQMKGDSIRRQTAMAEDWCRRNGAVLDTDLTFKDLGVSAYRGRNLEEGALMAFREAVLEGIIPEGSFLLIENLDRFSRTDPLSAVGKLREVCTGGVSIVTLDDGKIYTADSLTNDHMSLIFAIMLASRANEESRVKSARIKAAWDNKRQHASTRKLTSKAPSWLSLSPDRSHFNILEERVAIVRRIFKMSLDGLGQTAIAETLNRESVPTFSQRALYWHRSTINKLLRSPSVVGTFVPHTIEHDANTGVRKRRPQEPVPGYYPSVVDAEDFETVQAMLRDNRAPRGAGGGHIANIFASLAKCPICGGSMRRVNKGRKGGKPKFVCSRAMFGAGCDYHTIDYTQVEAALIDNLSWLIAHAPSKSPELDAELDNARAALGAIDDEIDKIVEALRRLGTSEALEKTLRALEAEKITLGDQVERLEDATADATGAVLTKRLGTLEEAIEARDLQKANATLRSMLTSVVVDYMSGTLVLNWKHGGTSSLTFAWPRETDGDGD